MSAFKNEFIIKINKDKNGQEVSLDNISIDAADALNVFISSLTEFAKSEKNLTDINISLKSGCIETTLNYPSTRNDVNQDIQNVFEGNSVEVEKVKIFKKIQDKIKANGLDYSVLHKIENHTYNVTDVFKSKSFKVKKNKPIDWFYDIIFVEGQLNDIGGKIKTNAHIEDFSGFNYTIDCTKDEAKKFKSIFEDVFVCILRKYKPNVKVQYELIDIYLNKEKFIEYKNLYEIVNKNKSLERFDIIHDKIESILNDDISNGELLKLMRLYNNPQSDRGILRTILMALKRVEKSDEVLMMYNKLAEILRVSSDNNAI
jgi:hypothetical protein